MLTFLIVRFQGIPVGTPFLEGFPPGEEFPKVTWITQLVTTLLSIAVGTFRCVLIPSVLRRGYYRVDGLLPAPGGGDMFQFFVGVA